MKKQPLLPLPEPDEWTTPKGKHTCGRDPKAGPGTCWHWWEGCPKAEARGCYIVWKARKCVRESNDAKALSWLKANGIEP